MGYQLGVDLGTTYCAAAVHRNDRVDIVTLGNRASSVPSVAYMREDGEMLVGEAAERRASSDPQRAAREFKRRVGDPVPIVLGGETFAAEQLMALQLPPIIRIVSERQGSTPDALTLTVPANWSAHRRSVFTAALPTAHLPPLNVITEPEAAAIHYAQNERIEPGEIVAVYDLGGGTFDAAILRRTVDGFEVLGTPEGIDRLGGIDFDAAVFSHVDRVLDGALSELDATDPIVAAGIAQLRASCVEAKEALSEESDTEIPVMLPGLRTEIRMTRAELEAMIRPALNDSVGALRRALSSAEVHADEVTVVLLVGGSSRIPLVAQMVGSELGRPVAVDAHPKHAIALGAALAPHPAVAAGAPAAAPVTPAPTITEPATPEPEDPSPLVRPADAAAPAAATVISTPPTPEPEPPTPTPHRESEPAAPPPATVAPAAASAAPPAQPPTPEPTPVAPSPEPTPAAAAVAAPDSAAPFTPTERTLPVPAIAGAVAALVALAVIAFLVLGGGDGDETVATEDADTIAAAADEPAEEAAVAETTSSTTEAPTTTTTEAPEPTTTTSTTTTTTTTTTLPPNPCDELVAPFICMDEITVVDGRLSVAFTPNGFTPDTRVDHIHFYFNVGVMADNPLNAGTSGPARGDWVIWDAPNPATPFTVQDAVNVGATELCALMAGSIHSVNLGTGHCLPIEDLLPA